MIHNPTPVALALLLIVIGFCSLFLNFKKVIKWFNENDDALDVPTKIARMYLVAAIAGGFVLIVGGVYLLLE